MSLNYQLAHGSKFELDITFSFNNTGFKIKQANWATTVKCLHHIVTDQYINYYLCRGKFLTIQVLFDDDGTSIKVFKELSPLKRS